MSSYLVFSVVFFLTTTTFACALLTAVVGIVAATAIEGVVVAINISVDKVEYLLGVDSDTHVASLEVEMWTSAASSVTTKGDRSASFHILILLNKELREVTIHGLKAVVVAQDNIESVAVTLKFCEPYFAGKCSVDSVANISLEVGSLVHAAKLLAITKM